MQRGELEIPGSGYARLGADLGAAPGGDRHPRQQGCGAVAQSLFSCGAHNSSAGCGRPQSSKLTGLSAAHSAGQQVPQHVEIDLVELIEVLDPNGLVHLVDRGVDDPKLDDLCS